jgi:hypothetical protein
VFSIRFKFRNNIDFVQSFVWIDNDGNPIILTGSTLRLHVKRKPADAKPVLEMTSDNGLATILADKPNEFVLKFPRYALAPGTYVFDLKRLFGGDHLPLADGVIEVIPGVTT